MNDILRKTLQLVYSSKRQMPAHFTSNGDRTQSFCIDFEPLTKEIDASMAAEAWGSINLFLKNESLAQYQFSAVMMCGEDMMLGAFILTKLNGSSSMDKLKKNIIEDTVECMAKDIKDLEKVLSKKQVNKYFDYCLEYGRDKN